MGKNYRLGFAIAVGVNLRQNTRENSRFQVIPGNVLKAALPLILIKEAEPQMSIPSLRL